MKPVRKLRKKYGRLAVLSEETVNSRRIANVRCSCSREKQVLVDSLLSGRTKSCGFGACKKRPGIVKEYGYVPHMPRVTTPETIAKAWARYHHEDPTQRRTTLQLAAIHKIKIDTLRSLFASVRRTGGIKPYLAALTKD